jgi:hypothetical protein
MSLKLIFYLLGFVTIPFYFFESGGLQISDLFFLISLLVSVISGVDRSRIFLVFQRAYWLIIFTGWVLAVNVFYYVLYGDTFLLKSGFFMTYNLITFIYTFYLLETYGDNMIKFLYYGFVVSIIAVFLVLVLELDYVFNSQVLFRRTGTFNNPNQLGYFGLLSLIMIVQLKKYLSRRKILLYESSVVLMLMSIYFLVLSLSKAALLSGSLVLIQSLRAKRILILGILFTFFSTPIVTKTMSLKEVTRVVDRLEDTGSANDDNLEGRNYDRIWRYPQYMVLGAGEGAFVRFGKDNEIHSSVATIFFSYGIVGLFLVSLWVYSSRIVSYWTLLALLAIGLYSLTHIGHRFKLFWVILTLFSYINSNRKPVNEN